MAPQIKLQRKLIMAGAMIFRSKKAIFSPGAALSPGRTMVCPFNLKAKKKEHKDRPAQVRKRTVKLYRLIKDIPKEGATARAKVGPKRKWPMAFARFAWGVILIINARPAVSKHARQIPWKNRTTKKGQKGRSTTQAKKVMAKSRAPNNITLFSECLSKILPTRSLKISDEAP